MDRYVRGIENGAERDPRVRAFVMGENAWRTGETLPLPGTKPLSLYLAPGGMLGREARPRASTRPQRFVSDPARPLSTRTPKRRRARLPRPRGRPDISRFRDRAPRGGPPRRRRRSRRRSILSADAPDADLWVKLEDVAPDGTAWNLSSPGTDVLRVSERDGGRAEAARPGSRPAAPAEPADRKPLREGPSRPRRALRQLHAALLAQPSDGGVRGALGEDPHGDDPDPPRARPRVAHRPAGRSGRALRARPSEASAMRIAIYGAGGAGGRFGAELAGPARTSSSSPGERTWRRSGKRGSS